ncbi:protein kinase domain-containing protein [Hamadaea tsunoensis]|uniref:protein kinase domain-containing protein n=1 Tax=Hamadaea tsunoensis TaxID=53368 RepID=UPI00042113D6|nr:protein kinase [Hamadaea tsunoensis]
MIRAGIMLAGRYEMEQRIASGGMGEVWRAFDRVLGRTVAVKCLLSSSADEPEFVQRFRDEARIMATVSHPGVVEVYDFGDDPVVGVYLVMKFIEGESLARALSRLGRLSPEATMRLVAEAAEALHAAHLRGVTHRDVKPGNLLLRPDGSAVLTDFGIARSAGTPGHTMTGSLMGTAEYLAPERAHNLPATAQSDIYSLGVVAYRCLAGRLPFAGDNMIALALRHLQDDPPPLPADVPPRVRGIVQRAMAKDPAARWATAAELALDARQALGPEEPATVRVAAPPAPVPPKRRRKLWIPVAAVLLVAVAAAGAIVLSQRGAPQSQSTKDDPAAAILPSDGAVRATEIQAGASQPGPQVSRSVPATVPSIAVPSTGTGASAKPGAQVPAAPKNLTATATGPNTIRLRWAHGSADESGFTVINGSTSKNVRAGATTFDWTGLRPASYSCFKVRAYNAAGASAYTPAGQMDWVCATTLDGSGPAAPSGLFATMTAVATDSYAIRLAWTDNSTDEDGFTVINGSASRDVPAGTTTYSWGGLAPGTYMCFKVRAFNAAGVSAYFPSAQSDWVCVTTPSS